MSEIDFRFVERTLYDGRKMVSIINKRFWLAEFRKLSNVIVKPWLDKGKHKLAFLEVKTVDGKTIGWINPAGIKWRASERVANLK